MFVVVACIGYTINVVASRTTCVHCASCLGIASPICGTNKMDVEVVMKLWNRLHRFAI